jgi:hypothetical protein
VVTSVEAHGHVNGSRREIDRLDRGEVVGVGHVRYDETALAAVLDQGYEPRCRGAVRVHDEKPAVGMNPARFLAKPRCGETADPVSTELDQSLGLLS